MELAGSERHHNLRVRQQTPDVSPDLERIDYCRRPPSAPVAIVSVLITAVLSTLELVIVIVVIVLRTMDPGVEVESAADLAVGLGMNRLQGLTEYRFVAAQKLLQLLLLLLVVDVLEELDELGEEIAGEERLQAAP